MCLGGYLQTIGIGPLYGKLSLLATLGSLIVSGIYLVHSSNLLYAYYIMSWILPISQLLFGLVVYKECLTKKAKIRGLSVNLDDFCFILKSMLQNSLMSFWSILTWS